MPKVEKLFGKLAAEGVTMRIDEDYEARKTVEFRGSHKTTVPNFHDIDGVISEALGVEGFPRFILLDTSCKIVFSMAGFDKSKLQAAVSRLCPQSNCLKDGKRR
jgi:hypothetical protein